MSTKIPLAISASISIAAAASFAACAIDVESQRDEQSNKASSDSVSSQASECAGISFYKVRFSVDAQRTSLGGPGLKVPNTKGVYHMVSFSNKEMCENDISERKATATDAIGEGKAYYWAVPYYQGGVIYFRLATKEDLEGVNVLPCRCNNSGPQIAQPVDVPTTEDT